MLNFIQTDKIEDGSSVTTKWKGKHASDVV
jgi:hypothetical protein